MEYKTDSEKREHCFQHFNYYPLICKYNQSDNNDINSCDQKFYTFVSSKEHLESQHKVPIDEQLDDFVVVANHFDYEPIAQIDDIIDKSINENKKLIVQSLGSDTRARALSYCPSGQNINQQFVYKSEQLMKSYQKPVKRPRGRPSNASINRSIGGNGSQNLTYGSHQLKKRSFNYSKTNPNLRLAQSTKNRHHFEFVDNEDSDKELISNDSQQINDKTLGILRFINKFLSKTEKNNFQMF